MKVGHRKIATIALIKSDETYGVDICERKNMRFAYVMTLRLGLGSFSNCSSNYYCRFPGHGK